MWAERTVRSPVRPQTARTLTLTRSGGGTVSSKPKGIKCAPACDTAVAALPQDTVVELKAKAASGSKFSGWEGCEVLIQTELESTCEVELASAKAVKATFTAAAKPLLNPKVLTLTKAGTGYGTVKATGLTCEAACTATAVEYFGGESAPPAKKKKPGNRDPESHLAGGLRSGQLDGLRIQPDAQRMRGLDERSKGSDRQIRGIGSTRGSRQAAQA